MATIDPIGVWHAKGVHKVTWEALTSSGDTINGYPAGGRLADRTVYVTGNFQSATIVKIQGSNNTVTGPYIDLTDPQGNPISFSGDGIEAIQENPLFIKPTVSGATGGSDVDMILVERGP